MDAWVRTLGVGRSWVARAALRSAWSLGMVLFWVYASWLGAQERARFPIYSPRANEIAVSASRSGPVSRTATAKAGPKRAGGAGALLTKGGPVDTPQSELIKARKPLAAR